MLSPVRAALTALALCCPVLLAKGVSAQPAGGLPSLADILADDALLRDIQFVDARHGWAVGDRGVILRTTNGGRVWRRLASPVEHPLHAVCFVTDRVGWVGGGYTKPYTHSTHAVVLKTEDGGDTWRRLPAETLPLLRTVKFFDAEHGVAAGVGAPFAPSGVFVTKDAGKSWQPLPGDQPMRWRAADFVAPGVGAVAGRSGQLATTTPRGVERSGALAGDRRGLNDLVLTGPTGGWMVGDGGLLLATGDGGRTWQPTAAALPAPIADLCDWHAVTSVGPNVWVAGAPGSAMLHSPDNGATWQAQATGVAAPIHAISFVDAQRGWAAGALGTILTTTNGGRTWSVQRKGGGQAAAMVLAATPATIPLDLVAALGAAEGYRLSVESVFANTPAAALGEAAAAAGSALSNSGWRLRLDRSHASLSAEQLIAEFDRQTDGHGWEELERQLVTRIRTLRPEALIVAAADLQSPRGAEAVIEAAAKSAIEAAADPTRYVELGSLGLSPHEVRRLAVAGPTEPRTSPRLATGDFNPLLGTSPAQWVGSRRGLLHTEYRPASEAIGWRVVLDNAAAPLGGRDPMAGIALNRGGDARRPASSPPAGELAKLRAVAKKTRNMRQLLAQSGASEAWIGQAVNLTSGLDPDSGAELLYQLADGYRQAGKNDLAADSLYLLAKRYTDHPLADSALAWLLRYYASGEVAHTRSRLTAQDFSEQAAGDQTSGVRQASVEMQVPATSGGDLSKEDRLDRAAQLGKYLEQARPALFADPAIRFPIAAAQRGLGYGAAAERYVLVLAKQAVDPAWKRCAEAERWLAGQSELPPAKPIATCFSTTKRPMLDGALDEACWQKAEALQVGDNTAPDSNAVVRLARDDEFLYIAIDCSSRTNESETDGSPRPRDGDLSGHDRLTLRLDTDRDYTTAFELSIDSRGWTADRCWGDRHWNPRWFVASGGGGSRWTAEAAIPLKELSPEAPRGRVAWALEVTRESPGAAATAWTGAADSRSPDRFGLLLFR